ncbi:MAG: hypothetical protein PHG97_04810 [Candidatus Margulisbacteria bacterium]|nr:hypothetical protein [Candidatus Margulisiibacteriota bacterium]
MTVLLIAMALAALWAVMASLFLRATIALALTSVILTVIMFRLGAPLAAVFELSVCAGLISVIFISVISLTQRLPIKEFLSRRQSRITRFRYLPLILIVIALLLLYFVRLPLNLDLPRPETIKDVRSVMWDFRRFDLFGQIMVLLAGVYGVIILFKGSGSDER